MRVFSIGADDSFTEYEAKQFEAEHEEAMLQKWLEANPDGILEDGRLLIIGRRGGTTHAMDGVREAGCRQVRPPHASVIERYARRTRSILRREVQEGSMTQSRIHPSAEAVRALDVDFRENTYRRTAPRTPRISGRSWARAT